MSILSFVVIGDWRLSSSLGEFAMPRCFALRYRDVISHATDALAIDGGSAKARYRRATAYFNTRDTDSARKDCEAALLLDPRTDAPSI